jgi:hypothetical protein
MTIGFSPFLTADVDETFGFPPRWSPANGTSPSDSLSVRLELIRGRVLSGHYSSATMATELARRLLERGALDEAEGQ